MISLVRCSVRTIRTSKELAIPSFASRAALRAVSTRGMSSVNFSADPSEEIGSNSEWLSAAKISRWGARERRSCPTLRRASTSVVICSSGLLLGLARTLMSKSSSEALDLVERAQIAGHDPFEKRGEKRWRIETAKLAFAYD